MAENSKRKGKRTGLSRRRFLSSTAAGAGFFALGCADEKGSAPEPAQILEHWPEIPEFDVRKHPGIFKQLAVQEAALGSLIGNKPAGVKDENWPRTLYTYNGKVPGPTFRMGGDSVLKIHLVNSLSGNNGTFAHNRSARFAKGPDVDKIVPAKPDWQLAGQLLYGPHQQHTTNLHTHGFHVSPNEDQVLLRIIPQDDYDNRAGAGPEFTKWERKVEHFYDFKLGASSKSDQPPHEPVPTHPPGTHWYHPHPHGATFDQVASGMAGFLIVEGDVDDRLKAQIKGYRERLILVQRVMDTVPPGPVGSPAGAVVRDEEGAFQGGLGNRTTVTMVNEVPVVVTVTDDKNQKVPYELSSPLTMVMRPGAIERWRVLNGSVDGQGYFRFAVIRQQGDSAPKNEDLKEHDTGQVWLDNLAFDGVTLVDKSTFDYTTRPTKGLVMAPANRADYLFKAPQLEAGETRAIYWIVGLNVANVRSGQDAGHGFKIARIVVEGEHWDSGVSGGSDGKALNLALGRAPEYLRPLGDGDVMEDGKFRTRQLIYSGWGDGGSYICLDADTKAIKENGKNSMVISRTRADGTASDYGYKFDPDTAAQTMRLGKPEQWTLDNYSTDKISTQTKKPGAGPFSVDHPFHMHQNPFWVMHVLRRESKADGTAGYEPDPNYEGALPRWQDTVPMPRNGGRVIFRSRFPDYAGSFVNHCHLLQHEDWGMMQRVDVTLRGKANYLLTDTPPSAEDTPPTLAQMADRCQSFLDLETDEKKSFCIPDPKKVSDGSPG